MNTQNIAISCRDLRHRYNNTAKNRTDALDGITLDVQKGELLAIIGHTGSGKSTFVQHLNALLKPTDGTVFVDGKNIWENKAAVRQARFLVGLCFQYPEYQLFEETVAKDIAFGPKNMKLDGEEIQRRVRFAADCVGLGADLLAKSPFDLSGGEKRRAAIAGVIAMRPQVLVLDEPTAGLDPRGKELILRMIDRYRLETGSTILLISHHMEDVARLADSVLVLHKGKIAMRGTVAQVFSQPEALAAMGLAVPNVTQIFCDLNKRGLPVSTSIFTIEDAAAELLRLKKQGGATA
ncbi:MAG: energy-coupling factor transporter ATPase [Oscillospiraceae bacterium]|jgi:energy-coupling factor transport system ATP-binding protein|nr:energy-coupling factor transporter ATPase [Oscillospiraceae bacterium]